MKSTRFYSDSVIQWFSDHENLDFP
jgi:hypothetical protein